MKQLSCLLLAFFTSYSLEQNVTTQKEVKKRKQRPGTQYVLAPHLDYDDSVYNPPPAFEPYWPVGEWVYEESYSTFYTTTSTKPPLVFGRPCPKHYRHIKEVCTHRLARYWKVHGCHPLNYYYEGYECAGKDMDIMYGYRTFPTFCVFLEWHERYAMFWKFIFVHVGPCINQKPLYHPYNPLFSLEHLPLRFDFYMNKLNETFFNMTTEEDLTVAPPIDMADLVQD